MRPLRVSIPLLAICAIGGCGVSQWTGILRSPSGEVAGEAVVSPFAVAVPVPAQAPARVAPRSGDVVQFFAPEITPSTPSAPARPPAALSAEGTALVAEVSALQLLAPEAELDLSARQWSALAEITLQIQAIRQAYEASIATATATEPGRFRVEIPAYAAAGDALRAKFHDALREQLGEANATEILDRLGARLEGHFGGFGVSVQTLDITAASAPGVVADYAVTRTVQFWNSIEGQARLTTRRETHFPAQDDPTGETWQPFLALITARSGAHPGS